MQTVRIVQAVALMLIVAMAASCAASKEYSSKLFAPRTAPDKDSTATALRFLETDNEEKNSGDWVTTDIIMGRDTANKSLALDNFSKQYPAAVTVPPKTDSSAIKKEPGAVLAEAKPAPVVNDPVAKTAVPGTVRAKKSREE